MIMPPPPPAITEVIGADLAQTWYNQAERLSEGTGLSQHMLRWADQQKPAAATALISWEDVSAYLTKSRAKATDPRRMPQSATLPQKAISPAKRALLRRQAQVRFNRERLNEEMHELISDEV